MKVFDVFNKVDNHYLNKIKFQLNFFTSTWCIKKKVCPNTQTHTNLFYRSWLSFRMTIDSLQENPNCAEFDE